MREVAPGQFSPFWVIPFAALLTSSSSFVLTSAPSTGSKALRVISKLVIKPAYHSSQKERYHGPLFEPCCRQ